MDEMKENRIPGENDQGYTPRPLWQVWMARAGLVLFLLFVVWQLIQIATAGML